MSAPSLSPAREPRLVKLQINTAGAWRDVMTFDVADEDEVLHAAGELVKWAPNADRISLRAIIPGDTAPLMTWNKEMGWREWTERGAR